MISMRYSATVLLVGLLATCQQARAQTNFRPGYVLPLTGDTLRGEVDSRDGRVTALRCRFRSGPEASATEYLPAQLRGYGLTADNTHYRSLPVAIGTAAAQPFFLEVIADGPASLYFFRDAGAKESYYVTSPTLPLTVLEHGTVEVVRDNKPTLETVTTYRNTLAAALAGCYVVQSQLPHLPFQENQLIKVVKRFNTECAGYKPVRPQATTAKSHITFGVMAGVAQQTLTYEGFPYPNGVSSRRKHMGMAVGPTLRFTSGRLGQRVSLVAGLLYVPEKFEIGGVGTSNNGFVGTQFRHSFDLAYLRLPVMVRYTYPKGRIAPIVEAGVTVSYAIKDKTTAEVYNYNKQVYEPASPIIGGATGAGFRGVESGFGVGAGVGTHVAGGRALALLFRAETANGFTKSLEISTSLLHFYGLLSLDLTK